MSEDTEGGKLPKKIVGATTYTLIRRIASGGMGEVFEALQSGSRRFTKRVAVKTVLPKFLGDEEALRAFIEEAGLVADLVHTNIAQVYQLGESEDGTIFIVMELVEGINLFDLSRTVKKMPWELAFFVAAKVARALEYAHARQVVHRDVSLGNVMITREGEPKLLDFGVAKQPVRKKDTTESLGIVKGKVTYLSPEQLGSEVTDGRTDVWSLGVVLFELLTGVNPFYQEGDELRDVFMKIKKGEIPHPSTLCDCPKEAGDIVLLALERDLDKRHNSAQMCLALESFLYSKGYGPTIKTMAEYLAGVFPDRGFKSPGSRFGSSLGMDTKFLNM